MRKKATTILVMLVCIANYLTAQTCSADYTYTIDTAHHSVSFHDSSAISGHLITYAWTFGDGNSSSLSNPFHTYSHPGTYYVCLTVTADTPHCTSTICDYIVIGHQSATCTAGFNYTPAVGQTVNFMDHSLSNHTITSWSWDFGDGNTSTSPNPSHTYADTGIYNVCLIISDMHGLCVDTICQVISVNSTASTCTAGFTFVADSMGNVHLTNASTGTTPHTNFHWSFGDGYGSSMENPFHTYHHPGTYYVCLTLTDSSCTETYCDSIVITQPIIHTCNADFQYQQSNHSINFHNMSTGHFLNYNWDFGDGNSSHMSNPSHQYADTGHFVVCLYVSSPHCSDTICQTIYVAQVNHCQASFTLSTDTTTGAINFTNTSSFAATDFLWTFGDGDSSTLQNPSHIYSTPGHYTVCLFVTDSVSGCSTHSCFLFHTHHPPHHLALSLTLLSDENPTTDIEQIHSEFNLNVYPNPLSYYTTIEYTLKQQANVKLELYNVLGENVLSTISKTQSSGQHQEQLNVSNIAEGTYILKLSIDKQATLSKIIILR